MRVFDNCREPLLSVGWIYCKHFLGNGGWIQTKTNDGEREGGGLDFLKFKKHTLLSLYHGWKYVSFYYIFT